MPTQPLGGLLVPAVTPYDPATGDVDVAAVRTHAAFHLAAGCDGVLVAGSSGESALLDDTDRAHLVDAAREALTDAHWLLVGTGSESTRLTIARCRAAKDGGADAALVISPHYFLKRMTPAALRAHFLAVADASPLPVLLYNMPAYAHLVLSPELVGELAQHPNIIGMKDSAGDLAMLARYREVAPAPFRLLTGSGKNPADAIAAGADGAILAIALFATQAVRGLVSDALSGDAARLASARAVQERLVPLATEIAAALGPAGLKAAMQLTGMQVGTPRSPLLSCSDEELRTVRTVLETAGVLPAAAGVTA